ncbi:unnamed protein product [Durusdinium trenchii]|uniref:Uncharacterized protein n=1 Tax=Durusdinium trenchii TaxID=1381693 RepID=A0ABP0NS37_9DINO
MARHRAHKAMCPYRTLLGLLLGGIIGAFLLGASPSLANAPDTARLEEGGGAELTGERLVRDVTKAAVTLSPRPALDTLPSSTPSPQPTPSPSGGTSQLARYGFYLHVHGHPAAVIHQVREVKKWFPGCPIHVMSDGNMDFTGLCALENCSFILCPPANDRWHPWPFLRRLYDAAVILRTEFVILLEPDNTIHGPIKKTPEFDAGGLRVKERSFAGAEYVQRLAQDRRPGFKWTRVNQEAGLCGGSYYRTAAILDAFADENVAKIDWNMLGEKFSKEIYSSDFAMQFALAARGWTIMPWEESAQMHEDKEVPMSGPKDAAFRHYSGPVGKPTYELKWKKEDSKLAKERPAKYQGKDPNCQVCYSFQRYVELWGSSKCTNSLPFEYSDLLLQRYHPKLQTSEPCHPDIGSLCEPGKLHPRYSTTGTTSRPGSEASQPPSTTGTGLAPSSAPGSIYGFYLHVFQSPAAVIYQVRKLKEVFPGSPIHIMSDGGADFGPLCQQEGCTFSMCPPANDRWHPWPFFRRLYDAAVSLKTEFVIMLEPDNTIHGPIKKRPQFDAGGVLVRDRSFAGADYVEKLAKKRVSGYKWTKKNQQAGLCGGSYYKREAILDALSDERVAEIDWNMLGERFTKEIYSSDFALQYALAARGWTIMPWEEAAQMHNSKEIPMAGPKDAAFRHYSGPVGKPTYELKMRKEDNHLVKDQPVVLQSHPLQGHVWLLTMHQ